MTEPTTRGDVPIFTPKPPPPGSGEAGAFIPFCSNCRWFVHAPTGNPYEGQAGWCHAHPPLAVINSAGVWPVVLESDFCGDHVMLPGGAATRPAP